MQPKDKALAAVEIITAVGAIIAGFLDAKTASYVMLALFLAVWQVWLTTEVLSLRRHAAKQPRALGAQDAASQPEITALQEQPHLVYDRDSTPGHEIPSADSAFLLWEEGTFCMWVDITAELLASQRQPRYLFSHTSNPDDSEHPDAFCLCRHHERPVWKLLFHAKLDPRAAPKEFTTSTADEGVRLVAVRWDKRQGDVHVLFNDKVKLRRAGVTNWPAPGRYPVYIGGWVVRGWDSYAKTKTFDVRAYNKWLTDAQIHTLVADPPDLRR